MIVYIMGEQKAKYYRPQNRRLIPALKGEALRAISGKLLESYKGIYIAGLYPA
jgi:hypothetical protein